MWSEPRLSRRGALALGLGGLAACGFAPAYGPSGAAAKLRGAVAITTPESPEGFTLLSRLADRLGQPVVPRYDLTVAMTQTRNAAAINSAGDTTRFQLVGLAPWTLRDQDGRTLATGTAQTFASYAATGSTVATQSAARDAADRLATALADLIVADLTAQAAALP